MDDLATATAARRAQQRARIVATAPALFPDQVPYIEGLVTVDHEGHLLVPAFQLDEDGRPRPDVALHVARQLAAGMSGWAVWTWWVAVNGWLGEPPLDVADRGDVDAVREAVDRLLDPDG